MATISDTVRTRILTYVNTDVRLMGTVVAGPADLTDTAT